MKGIKGLLVILRKTLLRIKIYFTRTANYVSLINTGMIAFLFADKLNELGVLNVDLDTYFVLIFFCWCLLLIFIGWVEVTFIKGLQDEASQGFYLNPPLKDMKEKVDYIFDKMEKGETIK